MISEQKAWWASAFGGVFAIVGGIALGIITAASFIMLFPQLALIFAVIAGFAGAAIEGEVFWNEVRRAFVITFVENPIAHVKHSLAQRELSKIGVCPKYLEYKNSLQALNKLTQRDQQQQALYIDLQEKIYLMEEYFLQALKNPKLDDVDFATYSNIDYQAVHAAVNNFSQTDRNKLVSELNKKTALTIGAITLSIITGIGFMAITYADCAAIVATLALHAALPIAPIFISVASVVLAGIAGVAYTMLMAMMFYRAINKINSDGFFHSLWLNINDFFQQQKTIDEEGNEKKEPMVTCIIRCTLGTVLTLGIIALSVFAMIATAGAWLQGGKEFFTTALSLTFTHVTKAATIISQAFIFIGMLPVTMLFAIRNSLRSTQQIFSRLGNNLKVFFEEKWADVGENLQKQIRQ